VARLGDYIREECNPLGPLGARELRLIGVSNEHGLHSSSRDTSSDLSRYQRIEKNWFAYNPMRVNVGSIGLADDELKTGFTSPDYTVFSCREGLDPHYLLHFLKSDYGLEAIARNCTGAVRKRLYYSGLADIELPVPSMDGQRAFVARISHINEAIRFIRDENSDRHELPQLKQAILQEAIQGKLTADWRAAHPVVEPASQLLLRIQAEKARLIADKKLRPEKSLPKITPAEIPFEIPKGWEWCRLGAIARHSLGKMLDHGKNKGSPKPYLRNLNVQWFRLVLSDLKEMRFEDHEIEKYSVQKGDIVICEGGYPGQAAIWQDDEPIMFQKALHRVRFLANSYEPTLFVQYLKLADETGFLKDYFTGSGIKHFTGDALHKFVIPLPPLAEQAAIVERVESLMATCRALETEIEQARTHAADLLQAVLKEAFAHASMD
jgi:restriction endonuclease S subunit